MQGQAERIFIIREGNIVNVISHSFSHLMLVCVTPNRKHRLSKSLKNIQGLNPGRPSPRSFSVEFARFPRVCTPPLAQCHLGLAPDLLQPYTDKRLKMMDDDDGIS